MWQVCCPSSDPSEEMLQPAATSPSQSSQWGHGPDPTTATSLGWTLREEKNEAKLPPRTPRTGLTPLELILEQLAKSQGSHRLSEGGQGGMRAQPPSAVSYYHMLQWTCGAFFPAYSLRADNLILLISVGNVMSRWICPLNWYSRQKRFIYVYFIIGDAFLNLFSFGWFPIYPHIHKIKDKNFFWTVYFICISSMVSWGGFFCQIHKNC